MFQNDLLGFPGTLTRNLYCEMTNSSVLVNASTVTVVTFSSFDDPYNLINKSGSTASTMTIPKNGVYQIVAALKYDNNADTSGGREVLLYINGSLYTFITSPAVAGTGATPSLTLVKSLKKGDVLQIRAFQNSSANIGLTSGNGNRFSVSEV